MRLFASLRSERRDDRELGTFLWRRAYKRFERAVDRFHQVLEGVGEQALSDQLIEGANQLAALVGRVRELCVVAHSQAPSASFEVPAGRWSQVRRELSRAGNLAATSAEALAMWRLGSADATSVIHRIEQVNECVEAVQRAIDGH